MDPSQRAILQPLAQRYIWWKSPEEALQYPERLIAQVLDIGEWADIRTLERVFGRDGLRSVLERAEAGWFRPRSWSFWCYRLGLATPDQSPPPMPRRGLG